jgi:hypothetical protein
MKALTIWQPYASLLACGAKRFETRSWPTQYRGSIALHAAKKTFDTNLYINRELRSMAEDLGLPDIYSFDTLPLGAIIATAELVDCHKIHARFGDGHPEIMLMPQEEPGNPYNVAITGNELLFGDYAPGRYAWELTNVKPLPEPIPARGKQGIWNWEPQGGVRV